MDNTIISFRQVLLFILLFAQSAFCLGQLRNTKKTIDTHLIFDGRETSGTRDSMTKENLIRLFEENKVTVGHTSMHIADFQISWQPRTCDIQGPFSICLNNNKSDSVIDALPQPKKIAAFLRDKLRYIRSRDIVFIENIHAITPTGGYCEVLQPTILLMK